MPAPPPPKETRFRPGQSGNPGGKTRAQRKAEVEAAELAAKAQRAMLDALVAHIADNPAAALDAIKADPLRLIKDAMDRAYGTPTQTVGIHDARTADQLTDDELAALALAGGGDALGEEEDEA